MLRMMGRRVGLATVAAVIAVVAAASRAARDPAPTPRPPRDRAPPAPGPAPRTAPSAAARCSRRTTRGTRTCRRYPVRCDSANYVANISSSGNQNLHADFGGGGAYGIPFVTVGAGEPPVRINYTAYGDESDPGPFPIPIERAGRGRRGERRRPARARRAAATRVTSTSSTARSGGATTGTPTSGVNWNLALERAAPARLDVGRRGRPPDPPRPRPLRRGRGGPDQPRAALHGRRDAEGLHPPGDALRVVDDRSQPCRRWDCGCG